MAPIRVLATNVHPRDIVSFNGTAWETVSNVTHPLTVTSNDKVVIWTNMGGHCVPWYCKIMVKI